MAAVTLFCCSGCEILQEAMDAGALDTDNPNSEDYRPRFVVGIFSIVYYPRASELEKPVRDGNRAARYQRRERGVYYPLPQQRLAHGGSPADDIFYATKSRVRIRTDRRADL